MLAHEKSALPLPESLLERELVPNLNLVESALAWQESADNHAIICFDDPHYPSFLKQISAPPPSCLLKVNWMHFFLQHWQLLAAEQLQERVYSLLIDLEVSWVS